MYAEARILIEVVSAVMCFILLRFLIKPYGITGESRYVGLPLGFGFLGVTYSISAFAFYEPRVFGINTIYFQLIARTFAFIFIAITYFFSKKSTKNSTLTWKVVLTLLVAVLIISFLIISMPDITLPDYRSTRNYFRVIDLAIILYICIHTFRSHIEKPDQKTIWIPLSFTILLVSQYSVLLFQLDGSLYTLFAGLILRLVFLSILLFVSFGTFYRTEKEAQK
jgi:hypothetical protein